MICDLCVESAVDTMIDVKAKPQVIYHFLLQKGENVKKQDIENMITARRAKMTSSDDNDTVAEIVALFAAEDPFNMVTVDETERGHTGVLSFTTARMRALYDRFPELLLADDDADADEAMESDDASGGDLVEGVLPDGVFTTWEKWNAYVKDFSRVTKQKLKIIETRPAQARRDEILSKAFAGQTPPMPPAKFKWVKKVYVCTHGGSERKSRGSKLRVKRHLSWTGCPYRFVVLLVPGPPGDLKSVTAWFTTTTKWEHRRSGRTRRSVV